ncbi:hypothetical protein AAG906_020386 [Vitis piasezkii]
MDISEAGLWEGRWNQGSEGRNLSRLRSGRMVCVHEMVRIREVRSGKRNQESAITGNLGRDGVERWKNRCGASSVDDRSAGRGRWSGSVKAVRRLRLKRKNGVVHRGGGESGRESGGKVNQVQSQKSVGGVFERKNVCCGDQASLGRCEIRCDSNASGQCRTRIGVSATRMVGARQEWGREKGDGKGG